MELAHEKRPGDDEPNEVDLQTCCTVTGDEEPSEDDLQTCRRTADALPKATWLVACVAMCERFAFYGFTIILQNYIQYRKDDPLHPGALGLGQSIASLMVNMFQLMSYITPLPAAVVADQYLGRLKTLSLSLSIYALGLFILTITSIPTLLERGAGLAGVITCMVIVSLGLGGIKSTLPPFLAEQCPKFRPKIHVTKSGERVVVTHEETLEYAFNAYYWAVNIGSQSMVASTLVEKYVNYWASFLLTLIAICCALCLLTLGRNVYVDTESSPSVAWACRACYIAVRNKFSFEAARPDQVAAAGREPAAWDDNFITEMQTALTAARIGIPLVFYWLCQNQLISNTISQAGMMETHGIPNDLIPDANALAVVILLPIVTHGLNPVLRRTKCTFTPVARISLGFLFEALAMGYAAGVQALIYAAPPCYSQPLTCAASDGGRLPNKVSVAVQLPVYILEGLSEVFSNPAIYEYAFTVAPKSMKSVLQAVFVLTAAAGSGLGMALAPTYYNPALLVVYASLGGAMLVCAIGTFCLLNRRSSAA
ncbi:MAG: hypothetical protein M4579_005751 [Chaenotheca gracillima]|nr:MAG: hypothetical protein M4579_005751 [Chaenotheca gracillima]